MKKKNLKIHWFDGDQKPRRIGVYKRDYGEEGLKWCYFDGKNFGCGIHPRISAKKAYEIFGVSIAQSLPWAGIIK